MSQPHERAPSAALSRRAFVQSAAGAALAAGVMHSSAAASSSDQPFKITKGRIRQSLMGWCFKPMEVPQIIEAAQSVGLVGLEGVGSQHYPAIRKAGLEISLVGSHGFAKGFCDPALHDECAAAVRQGIDTAVEFGAKSVITFTGMKKKGMTFEQSDKACVEGLKKIVGYAEEKNINICLEHLNTRDDTHPMKGHPGYFGDDVDHCVDMIKKVDSPRMKLLFDIYHVQIMNGDVIRRLRQYQDVIGHYHTAGVPGRGELDENQEVNYPAVMRAIVDTGYQGFVAQEFIPTGDDMVAALRQAAQVCDV
ncbi:hydroxypyruvate isomerase family protein [Lignipirellula cremea]|uniref:Hydroxypyruvate isomerase n=1 Tax=Lignipirellula cremea TaxID=2528010 RepID=A0A518DUN7_9BACT|nr:TIM barrel protein [Lignipirellula cremea]QDU95550.1 Hydroxypyruvate isomerase [Lignipirellula cremea]